MAKNMLSARTNMPSLRARPQHARRSGNQILRDVNLRRALKLIVDHPGLSRADISRLLGLSRSAVSSIVELLLDAGLIDETLPNITGPGRPPRPLRARPLSSAAIGVLLDDSGFASVAAVDMLGSVVRKAPPRIVESPQEAPRMLAEGVLSILPELDNVRIVGIGIALPGVIDRRLGAIRFSARLGWTGVPIVTELRKRVPDMSIRVDNATNAAALAEQWLGAQAGQSILYFRITSAIGAALVLDGNLVRRAVSGALEVGHMVLDPSGPQCGCGRFGCLEALIEDELARYLRHSRTPCTNRDSESTPICDRYTRLVEVANAGDEAALQVVRNIAELSSQAIVNVINMIHVDEIVVESQLAACGAFLETISQAVSARSLSRWTSCPVVRPSTLGGMSATVGAAYLAWDAFWGVDEGLGRALYAMLGGNESGE